VTHIPAPHATLAPITEAQTDAFYAAAALGVAWLDARESSPRRFGPAADASWRTYAGTPSDLSDLDRLELLLRDASSLYPDAFSPRAVFALPGLTDDEPFGQWAHAPAPGIARDTFRAPPVAPSSARALLEAAARHWNLPLGVASALPAIGPTTRVLVVGATALLAVVDRFAVNRDLSLHEQIVVLTDAPALRHLAGLAALALGELRGPPCVAPDGASLGDAPARVDVLASSDDATAEERAAAEALLSRATAR
jgi:hypothetical protein